MLFVVAFGDQYLFIPGFFDQNLFTYNTASLMFACSAAVFVFMNLEFSHAVELCAAEVADIDPSGFIDSLVVDGLIDGRHPNLLRVIGLL